MTPELDALVNYVERGCTVYRPPDFQLVFQMEPKLQTYFAGFAYGLRLSVTIAGFLLLNL